MVEKEIDLVDNEGRIIYDNIIKKYSWIVKENQRCILSPDSDGLLCGLFMSTFLNWNIVGYYDGKVLALKKRESVKDCIFLDMEIFRNYVKSLGHHMVLYNKRQIPSKWFNFDNCIQPNNIRGYDAKTSFNLKYPLGAIHLLLGIVGHKKKLGIDKNWFIDSICPQTKFMISSEYAKTRSAKEIKIVIQRIKDRTENQVKVATTDGLMTYPRVIKKVFGYDNTKGKFNVAHHRNIAIKDEGFNYPIERLHNNLRQRTKTMRGFHGSVESANAILKGFEVYYNFITKHQTINKCPYELATDLKLNSENKWLELINLSKN